MWLTKSLANEKANGKATLVQAHKCGKLRIPEFIDNEYMKVVRLLVLCTGRL